MQVVRVEGLPNAPLDAAAEFHGRWLQEIEKLLKPLSFRGGVGGGACPPTATLGVADKPHPNPSPEEEGLLDLVLVFPPADHSHRLWRLAAVQELARVATPRRVNAIASDNAAAIAATQAYLAQAEGVTGQYLVLGDAGAGPVLSSAG